MGCNQTVGLLRRDQAMARCSLNEGRNIEGGAGILITAASLAPVRNGAGTGDIAGSASDSPDSELTKVAAATVVMMLVRLGVVSDRLARQLLDQVTETLATQFCLHATHI
jgi:hypothetical protein